MTGLWQYLDVFFENRRAKNGGLSRYLINQPSLHATDMVITIPNPFVQGAIKPSGIDCVLDYQSMTNVVVVVVISGGGGGGLEGLKGEGVASGVACGVGEAVGQGRRGSRAAFYPRWRWG